MKKLFISQPMNGRLDEEILSERENAITSVNDMFPDEDICVLDSFFKDDFTEDSNPLLYLGESLKLLSSADIVYFCDNWQTARGCRIEHTCAEEYGIEIVRD